MRRDKHEVSIEDGARRVGDRILLVVAFGEHRCRKAVIEPARGVASCPRARRAPAAARTPTADTARGRCFADGETDLALRLRETRQRIHDEQHGEPALAEIFGNGRRQPRAMQADERRIVGRRRDHHAAPSAFGPENAIDEFLHFAAAFANQSDDDHVGRGVARHHAEQHGFTDAGAGEETDALPRPTVSKELMDRTPTSSGESMG
jgi:hypothetical protein